MSMELNSLAVPSPLVAICSLRQVVTKITEYFWKFEATYALEAFCGVGADAASRVVLASHTGVAELKTTTKAPAPYPEARVPAINQEAGDAGKTRTSGSLFWSCVGAWAGGR